MNRDVFLSLLALDAYNRGYGQGVFINLSDSTAGQDEIGRYLGSAQIIDQRITSEAQAAGFYAIAYEVNGETVISYRGTNFPSSFSDPAQVSAFLSDFLDGWSIFTGFGGNKQVSLATDFFKAVSSDIEFKSGEPRVLVNPPTLVGHSLGGALAGYVASRATVDAVVFNPVPFGALAQADALHEALSQTFIDFERELANLHCYPTLDHSGLEFSALLRSGGLVSPAEFASMIGGIFPIALCGRSSL